jgi:ketosteroid isomerase-like protein
MSDQDVEIARRSFEAFKEGIRRQDWTAAFDLDLVSPDAEWVPVQTPGADDVYRGRERFVEFMNEWTEDFEDWSIELDSMHDVGDGRVVGLGRQWATGKGSGVPVEWRIGQIFEIENGRVIRIRVYDDPAAALAAAGMSSEQ